MSSYPMLGVAVDGKRPYYKKGTDFLKAVGYKKEFEDHDVDGCEHKFDRAKNKFCSICGDEAKKEEERWDYCDLVGEISDEVEDKTGLDFSWIEGAGWVLGVSLYGDYEEVIVKMQKSIPILKKYFPKDKPRFYY